MTHTADFGDAHQRHWEDAELLFSEKRLANADHLYGFSAECGLKAVMEALGMGVDRKGKPTKPKDRVHIETLWTRFQSFASGRGGAQYSRQLPSGTPFQNWSVSDRYAHRGYAVQSVVEQHRNAAAQICVVVNGARLDGRL